MPIQTGPRKQLEGLYLEDYSTSLGDYLGARAEESFARSPVPSLVRGLELDQAAEINRTPTSTARSGRAAIMRRPGEEEQQDLVSPEDLNQEYGDLGLTFSKPTKKGVAEILAERKREEIRRQSIVERGPGGIVAGTLGLGTDFLVSAMDPLNIASAFIPVVGEARFAIWAERYGVTAARVARGSVEGAVGAAAVEPVVLGAATQEQADYGMMDSALNIAFGTVLGGGLHAVGGAVADRLARDFRTEAPSMSERVSAASHATREAALRTAIAQGMEGRPIDVEPILATDRGFMGPETDTAIGRVMGARESAMIRSVPSPEEAAQAVARAENPEIHKQLDEQTKRIEELDRQIAERATQPEVLQSQEASPQARQEIANLTGEKPKTLKQLRTERTKAQKQVEKLQQEVAAKAEAPVRSPEAQAVAESLVGRQVGRTIALPEAARRLASAKPEELGGTVADYHASELADERLKEAPEGYDTVEDAEQALADTMELVDELNQALDRELDLQAADEAITDAKALGKGAMAAANCMLRR